MLLTNHQIVDELSLSSIGSPDRSTVGYWPGICGLILVVADCISMVLAVNISLLQPLPMGGATGTAAIQMDGLAILCIAIGTYLALKGRYSDRIPFWSELRLIVYTSLCAFAFEVMVGIVTNDTQPRTSVLVALLFFPAIAIVANRFAKYLLAQAGVWTIPVVAIGNSHEIAKAEAALKSDHSLGYRIAGRLDPATAMAAASPHRLGALLRQYRAKCLFIAAAGADELTQQVVECALQERVRFAIMMQPYPASTFALKPKSFFSHDTVLFSPQDGLSNPISRAIKSCMDILVALLALIATAPLLLVISVTNLLDGGPILFRQQRVGAGGRPFYCLKFRTMVVDADTVLQAALAESPELAAEWAARRKLANDPRITRFGRFLRKTSLDELPQLINVLRRDMSLVGPRPIVENEIAFYGEHIAQYYATRPGLTGLWQVSGRSNTSYARRVQLDVWYVNNWTIWHDIAVLLKTIPAVFGREGAF